MEKCVFHDDLKKTIQNHEVRIVELEKKDISLQEQISNLCDKLDMLIDKIDAVTKVMLAVGGIFLTALVGFVFWYIQSLGG